MAKQFLVATGGIGATAAAAAVYTRNNQLQQPAATSVALPAKTVTTQPEPQNPPIERIYAEGIDVMDKPGNGATIIYTEAGVDGSMRGFTGQKGGYKILIIDQVVSPLNDSTKGLTSYAFVQEPDGSFALWYKEEAERYLQS